MSLSEQDRQILDSIEEELAGSDPKLAAMLACFSRLTAGEDMPARESIRASRRRAACAGQPRWPRPARSGRRLAWARTTLALWLALTVALIGVAVAARHGTATRSCVLWSSACARQRQAAQVTQPMGR
jgi:Protein of unknown function (DUF3040)